MTFNYTDADVQAAAKALRAEQGGTDDEWSDLASSFRAHWLGDARAVLDAVAPAIAARATVKALRGVADRLSGEAHREPILQRFADKFTAHADEIEAGR